MGGTMKPLAVLVFLAAVGSGWAQQLGAPVVSVNGEAITYGEFYKRMSVLPGVGRMAGGQFVLATPGFLTLQQMINEELMIQLAKEKGVAPTDAEIQAEIDLHLKENPDFVKTFLQSGLSEADLRHDIRVQLSEFKVTTMGVTVTDFQVQRYYEDQKRQFTLPKRYRIRVIAASSAEKKQAVDAALGSGKGFAEVAAEHSEDLSRYDGGLIGNVAESALGTNMKTLVTTMQKGQTTPWLAGQSGTELKVFLEDILAEEVLPFDDVLKRDIWKKLMTDRGLVRNNMAQMMREMRAKVNLGLTGTPFDEQLKQAFGD